NIAKEMHMGHLQSAIIGETLARVLDFSGVSVHRRFRYGDYLDIESKMMMTEFLIDRFPDGEVNDQAIGELEVLYEESKTMFAEDAEFRERTQPVQEWDKRHKTAWEKICKISRELYCEVYQRLGVRVKEEGETLHDFYIRKALFLLTEKGYNTKSEGDEAIVFEGRKLPLVDFAAVRRRCSCARVTAGGGGEGGGGGDGGGGGARIVVMVDFEEGWAQKNRKM
ncbi:arginine--tRNA ligase, chloroplastic/mitochondrial-like protein isoform X2, partial [Tanacetum coccineum]